VSALAGAITGAVGFVAGDPGVAALAGASTPFLAVVFQKTVKGIFRDRSLRAETMLETAAETAGLSREQLAERADESEETRFLTEKAVRAAADTIWPEGVRAIGKAYAAGLLAKDKPTINIRQRVLGIMADLDELHVGLLDLLVKHVPERGREGVQARSHRIPSYVNTFMGGDRPDNPKVWSVGERKWTTEQICAVRPDLESVLPSLLGELREKGLAREKDTTNDAIKLLNRDLMSQVNRHAGQMQRSKQNKLVTLQEHMIQLPEPTWSPTELGEKVLGFYAEAGAENSQDNR
jgi:hypothetical protein